MGKPPSSQSNASPSSKSGTPAAAMESGLLSASSVRLDERTEPPKPGLKPGYLLMDSKGARSYLT